MPSRRRRARRGYKSACRAGMETAGNCQTTTCGGGAGVQQVSFIRDGQYSLTTSTAVTDARGTIGAFGGSFVQNAAGSLFSFRCGFVPDDARPVASVPAVHP